MTEREEIMEKTGLHPNSCSCEKCKNMCKGCPCLGTPHDILNLMNNGHVDKLEYTTWAVGILQGIPLIDMVQLKQLSNRHCIMLNSDGLCSLHDANLKPTEGVLATCNLRLNYRLQIVQNKPPLSTAIAKMWLDKKHTKTINLINKAMSTSRKG